MEHLSDGLQKIATYTGARHITMQWGSSIYGRWRTQTEWAFCEPSNTSTRPLIVQLGPSAAGRLPDARIYYAHDIGPQTAKVSRSLRAHTLNVLYTEESSEYSLWMHDPKHMRRFDMLMSFDPRPLPGHIFANFGFGTLYRAMQSPSPIVHPSRRMRNADGLIVWIAQNCGARSRRLEYLKRLAFAGVHVHSLGRCWRTHRFVSNTLNDTGAGVLTAFNGLPQLGRAAESQWRMLGKRYKFWFVAENWLCDGYITEKLWVAFAFGAVPVLFGTKSHAEYAPAEDALIEARRFASPSALASHLLAVDADDAMYMRYHAWRTRPLKELNQRFVALLRRFEWGGGSRKGSLSAHARDELRYVVDEETWRRETAPEWACHIALEVQRKKRLRATDVEKGGALRALGPCPDVSGSGLMGPR